MRDTQKTEEELVKSFEENDNEIVNQSAKKKFWIISIISFLVALIIIFGILIFTVFKKEENYDYPTELDTIPLEELNKARDSFKQFTYNESASLSYNLFIPENYNSSHNKKYPLMVFIADASTVGKEVTYPIYQTVGGPIWATDTVQKKHNCFVLIPQYKEIIIDDRDGYSKTEDIITTSTLILEILKKYNIDSNKVYGTGQSMGAMTILYLLANNQNLFTAGLIVDGQWKKDELLGLVNASFTYFAAGGDEKSFNGQSEIKEYFDYKNISYGCLTEINAREKVEILNDITKNLYDLGYKYNFISYKKGSVFPSNSKSLNEHMASFKYGYRIETVRDWIFEQNKIKCEKGLYYSEDGKCSLTNFCYSTKEDHSCSKCIYGYFLSSDKISCTQDINCQNGNQKTGLCNYCIYNYYLDKQDSTCKSNLEEEKFKFCKVVDNGVCIECEIFYYLSQDNKCSISPNCSLSENSLCIKCIDGFYLGYDHICTDIEKCIYSSVSSGCYECIDGFYYDCFDKICKESVDNFINCKRNAVWEQTQCFACKNNFYLSQLDYLCYDNTQPGPFYKCEKSDFYGRLCMTCIEGYFIGRDDSNCTKIEGCLMSLNEDTCLECDDYYCLDNLGNCTDNYYIIDEDKKFYYRCKKLNEFGTGCDLCENDLNTTDEGICYDDYHCIKRENGECLRCQKENPYGYYTYCFNEIFGCIDSFLKNCIRCDNIFDLEVCTECEVGYEIDEFGECIPKE